MSSTHYPKYINEILRDIDTTDSIENVLIKKADLINKDILLYNIYLDLGY